MRAHAQPGGGSLLQCGQTQTAVHRGPPSVTNDFGPSTSPVDPHDELHRLTAGHPWHHAHDDDWHTRRGVFPADLRLVFALIANSDTCAHDSPSGCAVGVLSQFSHSVGGAVHVARQVDLPAVRSATAEM